MQEGPGGKEIGTDRETETRRQPVTDGDMPMSSCLGSSRESNTHPSPNSLIQASSRGFRVFQQNNFANADTII